MSTDTAVMTALSRADAAQIRAHNTAVKQLGHWTRTRELTVCASHGTVHPDALQARREGRYPTIDDPSR